MLDISKNELMGRWDAMPQELKEAIWSEYNADILWETCRKEHLSEDKTSTVATITGDVIMGFLLMEDLAREIAENLDINLEIANRVAEEINKKIFEPIREDIKQIYSPPKEKVIMSEIKKPASAKAAAGEEKIISLETLGTTEKPPEQKVEIKTPAPKMPAEGKPFILHEEKPAAEEKPKAPARPFSFPFRVFTAKPKTEEPKPVRARVEEPERVVHYSELRTPLQPFGQEEQIINLETFQSEKPKPASPAPKPEVRPEPPAAGQPKLEGNVVNLK